MLNAVRRMRSKSEIVKTEWNNHGNEVKLPRISSANELSIQSNTTFVWFAT